MLGAPMSAVQELVGHRDLTMTQRYSHLTPHSRNLAIRLLDIPAGTAHVYERLNPSITYLLVRFPRIDAAPK
jgi:hypothetical protein